MSKQFYYAVRSSYSQPLRVIKISYFQAYLFGERKPYVFDTARQAHAVLCRLKASSLPQERRSERDLSQSTPKDPSLSAGRP